MSTHLQQSEQIVHVLIYDRVSPAIQSLSAAIITAQEQIYRRQLKPFRSIHLGGWSSLGAAIKRTFPVVLRVLQCNLSPLVSAASMVTLVYTDYSRFPVHCERGFTFRPESNRQGCMNIIIQLPLTILLSPPISCRSFSRSWTRRPGPRSR